MIEKNFKFAFNYIKSDITPTILDRDNEIILSNCQIINTLSAVSINDIPVKISSHPYVLVNRSVLYNCGIEVENNFLLESLAACHDLNS